MNIQRDKARVKGKEREREGWQSPSGAIQSDSSPAHANQHFSLHNFLKKKKKEFQSEYCPSCGGDKK